MSRELNKIIKKLPVDLQEIFKVNMIFLKLSTLGLPYPAYKEVADNFKSVYTAVRDEFGTLAIQYITDQMARHEWKTIYPKYNVYYDIIKDRYVVVVSIEDFGEGFSMAITNPSKDNLQLQSIVNGMLVEMICCAINLYSLEFQDYGTENWGTATKEALCKKLAMTDMEMAEKIKTIIKSHPESVNKYIYDGNTINFGLMTTEIPNER